RVFAQTLERWRQGPLGHVRWLNAYGVSEATITSTLFEPPALPAPSVSGLVPIGRPCGTARAYVLDPWLQLVPPGVEGELYLGGPGVAPGCVGQPQQTAARFLPAPYGSPGSRLYRSGDRARWRPDGALEYLGRSDEQLKVWGHRIEPAEIETLVQELPRVA